jgi:alpha-tubulin suppressor-like RCC1 family protein
VVARLTAVGAILASLCFSTNAQSAVVGWGTNVHGELGAGFRSGFEPLPVTVAGLTGVKQLVAASYTGYALLNDGTVRAWGEDAVAQLGDGFKTEKLTPVAVKNLAGVTQIAVGGAHGMALLSNGTVMTWGGNFYGQLGNGTRACEGCTPTLVPIAVPGLGGVKQIAASGGVDVALMGDGTVRAWGEDRNGQLGDGSPVAKTRPISVQGLTHVRSIVAGGIGSYGTHLLALLQNGTVQAIGSNKLGQLGDGSNEDRGAPVRVHAPAGVVALSTSQSHSLALLGSGRMVAWGGDGAGELGVGNTGESCGTKRMVPCSRIPRPVGGLTGVSAIGAGWRFSLALQGGQALSWGINEKGQLGDGTTNSSPVPVRVSDLAGVQQISGGETLSLALLAGEGPPPDFILRPERGALGATWRAPTANDPWAVQWRPFTKPHVPWSSPVILPPPTRTYTIRGLPPQPTEVRLKNKSFGVRVALATPLR